MANRTERDINRDLELLTHYWNNYKKGINTTDVVDDNEYSRKRKELLQELSDLKNKK